MHSAPITCLCLSEDQLILSGSTSGNITISDPTSVQKVATLRSSDFRGNGLSLLININIVLSMISFMICNKIIRIKPCFLFLFDEHHATSILNFDKSQSRFCILDVGLVWLVYGLVGIIFFSI